MASALIISYVYSGMYYYCPEVCITPETGLLDGYCKPVPLYSNNALLTWWTIQAAGGTYGY